LEDIDFKGMAHSVRANMPVIETDKRKFSFEEVELGFSEEQAKE